MPLPVPTPVPRSPRAGSAPAAGPTVWSAALGGALWLALALGAQAGCARRPLAPTGPARPDPAGLDPAQPTGAPSPARVAAQDPSDPLVQRLGSIDRLLVEWDQAQGEGRAEAQGLAARLRSEVDAAWIDVLAAHDGQGGEDGRYLATMALGFASRPEATPRLVRTLEAADARLVANALIALKLRADPATPLPALAFYLRSADKDVRRYAPLALAHVLEARRRAGTPADAATEGSLYDRCLPSARDADVLVRLHTVRLLGELALPEAATTLRAILADPSTRVQLAAASALGRRGERAAFPEVVRLLHEAPDRGKPLVAAILATYAERLTGAPLPAAERERLGTDSLAWSRWYGAWQKTAPP